ncbi:MAG: FecR domain-containing protein [Candidatus Omnitrophica bacterium]|nr:FecR domain-containing protein [Candidatus Omnitrophota bacterium]
MAHLSVMTGTVEVLPALTGQWQGASEGMELTGGDKIRTGIDGMLSITFSNGSIVTLKENAEFEIRSLSVSENKNDIDYKLKLTMGKLRAMVEELGDESSFEIETPTAVAAVRGTLFYLYVLEADESDISSDVKERLKTELFVEVGGIIYTNTASGKFFKVRAGKFSDSYNDGSITEPIDVPEDKQKEWTEGWEDILAAEPYQVPEGLTVPDITGIDMGGEEGVIGDDVQSDLGNRELDNSAELIKKALQASEKANQSAVNAHKAEADALYAKQDIGDKTGDLQDKNDSMNDAFNAASNSKDEASAFYDLAQANVQNAQQALTGVGGDVTEEENKNPHFVIVDIITLRNKFNNLQDQFNDIFDDFTGLGAQLDDLIDLLIGSPAGGLSLLEKLNLASAEAAFWAKEAEDLSDKLLDVATAANIEANDAALQALQVLIDATQEAIDRANQAAIDANLVAQEAENLLGGVPGLLAQMDKAIDAMNGISQDGGIFGQEFQNAVASAKELIDKAGEVKDDILSLISSQIQHEKDMVWQEINQKLREQQFLRSEVRMCCGPIPTSWSFST